MHPKLLETLQSAILSTAEIGSNRLLDLDPQALARCAELEGHCVEIDVTDLDFRLYCHPGNWGIRLSRNPPARAVDASIRGRLLALANLAVDDDKVSTSIRGQVSYNGQVAIAQKLQQLLTDLDLDWEEMLSRQIGDVLAFQIGQGLRDARDWLEQSTGSVLQSGSEYLREEARLSPTQVEFDRFQACVTELKHDVAQVENRLQQLSKRLAR